MIHNLKDTFLETLDTLDWMDDKTRNYAQIKVGVSPWDGHCPWLVFFHCPVVFTVMWRLVCPDRRMQSGRTSDIRTSTRILRGSPKSMTGYGRPAGQNLGNTNKWPIIDRSVGLSVALSVVRSVGCSVGQSVGRLFGWSIGCSVGRSPGALSVVQSVPGSRMFGLRSITWSNGWLACWLLGWLIGQFTHWLIHSFARSFIHSFIHSFIDSLIDLLIDWFLDSFRSLILSKLLCVIYFKIFSSTAWRCKQFIFRKCPQRKGVLQKSSPFRYSTYCR